MKTFNIADIRALKPCYDPRRYLKEDWNGTIIEFLQITNIPAKDRLYVALRLEFIETPILKRFALNVANHVKHLMEDKRSLEALKVIEDYLEGKVTSKTLKTAHTAAYNVAFIASVNNDASSANTYASSAAAYAAASVLASDTYFAYNASAAAVNAVASDGPVINDENLYQINMLIGLLN